MKVGEAMTRGVITVSTEDSLVAAMKLMRDHHFSGVPVVDGQSHVVGMLTEGDLMRRVELGTERRHPRWLEFILGPRRLAQEYVDAHGRRVAEVMTTEVVTIESTTSLAQAVNLMEDRHIKRLPVLEHGRLVGILSRSDLLRAFLATSAEADAAQGTSDDAIRQHIDSEIDRQPWNPRATVAIKVRQGTVDLSGIVTSEAMREALRVLVENIPGVVRIRDDITTIEPMSGFIVRSPSGPA
jgi:CBS domain-containing protein